MALLDVITYPDKFLTRTAQPVKNIDSRLQRLMDNMAATMYSRSGVGLAAMQVGVPRRIILCDETAGKINKSGLKVFINPSITAAQGKVRSAKEGCLSVPEFRADVERSRIIRVKGFDRDGEPLDFEADGMLSVIIQHEIDHLNGILFIDRISSLKRNMYRKKVLKAMKKGRM